MKIREIEEKDFKQILEITEMLKVIDEKRGWFSEESRKKMIPIDLKIQGGFVAEIDSEIVGFVTYFSEYGKPKIGWIAVNPNKHRQGIGKLLLEKLRDELKKVGANELYVETPTKEEAEGNDYESTYAFYESAGFVIDKIIKKNSQENECDCDMAVLKKVIK